jgi:hypothetical protein
MRIVEELPLLLLCCPDHIVSADAHALGELQKLPHAHFLDIAILGDVLGHVGKFGEPTPQVMTRQDIDAKRTLSDYIRLILQAHLDEELGYPGKAERRKR